MDYIAKVTVEGITLDDYYISDADTDKFIKLDIQDDRIKNKKVTVILKNHVSQFVSKTYTQEFGAGEDKRIKLAGLKDGLVEVELLFGELNAAISVRRFSFTVSESLLGSIKKALFAKLSPDGQIDLAKIVKKINELENLPNFNTLALKTELPKTLAQLTEDSTHRVVTDAEKTSWNNKLELFRTQSDWNKVYTSGFYSARSGTNAPTSPFYGSIIVIKSDDSVGSGPTDTVQIAVDIKNDMYIRNNTDKTDGSWTPWRKFGSDIVNDLTTGGTDKALSAEQGKLLFQSVDSGKTKVANAIIDKGQTGVSSKSTFDELAAKIKAIKTGYAIGDTLLLDKVTLNYEQINPTKVWEYVCSSDVRSVFVDKDGNVYSGDDSGKVTKLNPSGNKIWEYICGNYVFSVFVDKDGNVYSGDMNKKVIKLNPSGSKLWEYVCGNFVRGVFVDKDGNVYTGDDAKKVTKLNSSGNRVWEYVCGGTVWSVFVDKDGNVYVGDGNNKVTKLNSSGNKIWEYICSSYVYSVFVDKDGNVYTGDEKKKVTKLNSSGNRVWEYVCGGTVWSVFVDKDGNVYTGDYTNKVTKLNSSGNKIWEYVCGGYVYSVFVDKDSNIYAGDWSDRVTKLSQNGKIQSITISK